MRQVETIQIVIREDGSRVVTRNIQNMTTATGPAERGLGLLKKAIAGLVAGATLGLLKQFADAFTTIQNRLRLTTTDQANLNAVFKELQDISSRTRSSLQGNAELYSRISLATKDLGTSQKEVLQFTESLNKAVKISGATAIEADAAIIQLSQGLASGALRGDELRSVLEQLPAVADVIAKSLGVTRGQLRKMGEDGKITAEVVLKAFREARGELDEKFKKTLPTIGEGFVLLKNQVIETVGRLDQATGASAVLGGAFLGVVNFIKQATPEMVNFVRALTGTLDPTDKLSDGSKVFATILVTVIGVLQIIAKVITTVVIGAFKTLGRLIGGIAVSLGQFGQGLVSTFFAVADTLKSVGTAIGQAAKGNFAEAGRTLKDAFTDPFKEAKSDFAAAGQTLDAVFDDINANAIEGTKALATSVVDGASQAVEKLVKIWDVGARAVQDRQKEAIGKVSDEVGKKKIVTVVDEKAIEKERKAMERLENQLKGVLNQIAPVIGAKLEMKDATETLDLAQKKGLITQAEEDNFVILLKKHYEDILDPIGKYNREIDEQARLLGMTAREREVEAQVMEASKSLLKDYGILTEAETKALREKFQALQQLNELTAAQDQLLSDSVETRRSFTTQLAAIQNLLANPTSGFTKGDAGAAVSDLVSSMGLDPSTLQAQADMYEQTFRTMYENIALMRQMDLISEQEAAGLRAQVWAQQQAQQLKVAEGFFGQLAQLQKSENSKIAAIGKAAAITQAIINTYQAATAAYASLAGIPYIGPALGAAAAAAAVVAGMANVAQIRSQPTGFMTGGTFNVPGATGGADSQMIAFRASPGEKVTVQTPEQARKGDPNSTFGSGVAAPPQVNQRIINLIDPGMVGDFLSTPEGESVLVNTIRRNADSIRSAVT